MIGYKGFDQNWRCRGKQYEVGKTYEEEKAVLCQEGMHFCENPFDVFTYYSSSDRARYAEVEADDVSPEKDIDSKRVCKKLTIKAELNIIGIVKAGMAYIKEHIDVEKIKEKVLLNSSTAATSGYRSTAATSGNSSTAATSGDRSTAIVEGDDSIAISVGIEGRAKGAVGCWLVLSEWGKVEVGYKRKSVKCFYVDGKNIKADTLYMLKNGEPVEISDDEM